MSGLRRRSEVHIFLDVEAFVGDGHECYLTPNSVLVTPEHVEARYFKYVTDSTDPSVDILSNTSVPQEYRISCGMTVREDAIYQVPRHSNSPERASSSAAADSRERASASAIDQEIEPALEIEERIPTGDTEDEAEREEGERLAAVRLGLIDSVNKFFNGEEISDLRFDVISVVTQEKMTEMGMGDRFQELQDLIQERRVIREATEESQEARNVVDPRERTDEQPPRAKAAFTDFRLKSGTNADIPDFVSFTSVTTSEAAASATVSRERAPVTPAAEAKPKMLQPPPMPTRPVPRPEDGPTPTAGPPPAHVQAKAKSTFSMASEFVTPQPAFPKSHVPPELHHSQIKAKLRDERHEEEGRDPRMPGPDEEVEMPEAQGQGRSRSKSRTRSRVREHGVEAIRSGGAATGREQDLPQGPGHVPGQEDQRLRPPCPEGPRGLVQVLPPPAPAGGEEAHRVGGQGHRRQHSPVVGRLLQHGQPHKTAQVRRPGLDPGVQYH